MNRAVLWFVGFLVLAVSSLGWAQSADQDPIVGLVTQRLTEQLGRSPAAEEVVEVLNRITVGFYGDGDYALAEELARAAYRLGQDALPGDHAETLIALNNLAVLIENQGRYGEAEPLYLRALQASRRVLGADHPQTLTSVNNLAALYESQGRTGEAEPLYLRALQARERLLGGDHPDTLISVNNLAELYRAQGRTGEAEPLYLRALQESERVLGADHPDTLISVNNLAFLYQAQGRTGEAEPLYLRALQASERVLGTDHPQTLTSVNNLAELYRAQGRTGEAEPLYLRALQESERLLGGDHPNTLISVNNLAALYHSQGRYREAEPLFLRAVQASERVLGADHPQTLQSVNNLTALYQSQGRYDEAEPLYLRAFQESEQVLGEHHLQTLGIVNNLADLYQSQGRYDEAEQLFLRALQASERVLGADHPQTLQSVNNLAELYRAQGRTGEAEPLYLRALQARERVLGADHPGTLQSVNNLAVLYYSQGRTGEAEPLYRRALQARERLLGANHPQTLQSVNNLAELYRAQGRTGEAEPLFLRALQASEQVLGADHPDSLPSVNGLAALYESQGRYGEAEPLLLRALRASERVLGADHPRTLSSVNNLAFLHRARGDYTEAEALLRQVVRGRAKALDPTHPDLSNARISLAATLLNQERPRARREALAELKQVDRELRAHVQRQLGDTLGERVRRRLLLSASILQDLTLTLALERPEAPTRAFAANLLLRWKRLAGEEEAFVARLIRRADDSAITALAEQLTQARTSLTHLINLPEAAFDKAAADAQRQEVERLEVALATKSRAYRQAQQEADWAAVQAQLPADSALLELRLFRPVDLKTGDRGKPRWAALLLPANATNPEEIQIWDLGPAKNDVSTTDDKPAAPTACGRGSTGRNVAPDEFEKLLAPLFEQLAKYEHLYISPDGPFELIPFHRLRVDGESYWAQQRVNDKPQRIHMLRTGRDLLPDPLADENAKRSRLVALGDVNYAGRAETSPQVIQEPSALAVSKKEFPTSKAPCSEFIQLKHTGAEIETIGNFAKEAGLETLPITGDEASEVALNGLEQPPRILHLATHGFFFEERQDRTERPLTLAGVALAGANRGMRGELSPEGEDGILYALEAQGLNLEGTELVTLSACDTGQGEVDYSEGVYGLVRAFQIAGAKNVLISLRKVDDEMAKEFMVDFYRHWFADPTQHPALALHTTRIDWIQSPDPARRDPKHWAPWVLWERR